jgi:hypothetical protein
MKTFIIALAFLFSSASIAQAEPKIIELDLKPTELSEFIQTNINRGLTSDRIVYTEFLLNIYNRGSRNRVIAVAMRYSVCSIIWRAIIEIAPETDEFKHEMVKHAIWRSIQMAKWFTGRAGGDPDQVETVMIPFLAEEDMVVSDVNIYSCTAFDVAGYTQLKANEQAVNPPEDWTLEDIPEPPVQKPESPGFQS